MENHWFEKKLINEYVVTNVSCNRETAFNVMIDGRKYTKYGKETATTYYARVYKILGPSVEPNKRYLLLIGVSRQNPLDFKTNKELAIETAAENSIVNPIITMWSAYPACKYNVKKFIDSYDDGMANHELIMTAAERAKYKSKKEMEYFDNKKNENFILRQEARNTNTDNNLDLLYEKYGWYEIE